ncbi:helix-turn-helix transcriptional regulator [Streptomyces sp. NPDC008001]|uniref:helix-turn-helix transcriptional regulator n=1 Tax=Streptomyces sp. NPDC008001 TaxID=3364804 RepID=UPI0036E0F0DC
MRDMTRPIHRLRAAVGERFVQDEMAELVSQAIGPLVAHDALRLFGMNPATGTVSYGFLHGFPTALLHAQLIDSYAGDDPFSPADIGRLAADTGLLGGGEHSLPGHRQAARTLAEYGAGSELRLLLRESTRRPWGLLALLRTAGGRPFDQEDAWQLTQLDEPLIALLKGYATARTATAAPPGTPFLPPGVVMVGPDDQVRSVSPQARAWLAEIAPERGLAPPWMPTASMREIVLAARRHAVVPGAPPALACSPAAFLGRRVAVHAQCMDASGKGEVAVVLQEGSGALLLPTYAAWHGLTARESEVIERLCSREAPRQIARIMGISVHTLNTHVRNVYRKTGTSGRDDLVAALNR